jgi:hypothetical protein
VFKVDRLETAPMLQPLDVHSTLTVSMDALTCPIWIQISQPFAMCPKADISRAANLIFCAFGLPEGSLRRLHIVVHPMGMLL